MNRVDLVGVLPRRVQCIGRQHSTVPGVSRNKQLTQRFPLWRKRPYSTPETRKVLQRDNPVIQIEGFRDDATCSRFIAARDGSFITQISEHNQDRRYTDRLPNLFHKVYALHSWNV